MGLHLFLHVLLVAVTVNAQGRNCPGLGCIAHGTVSNTQGPFLKDSVVTYRCYEGYELKGNEERKCMANGQWSGTEPRCEEQQGPMCGSERCHRYAECRDNKCKCKSNFRGDGRNCEATGCPRPGCFANGDHSGHQDFFTRDNKITYSCHPGHRLVGMAERTCLASGEWSGMEPRCEKGKQKPRVQVQPRKKIKKCRKPPSPPNGDIRSSDSTYRVGTIITYECRSPFTLVGNAQRNCQDNRKWSGSPATCKRPKKKTCTKPSNIANGMVAPKKKKYFAGNKIKYSCKGEYVISGNAERTCQASGHWSGSEPRCAVPDPCQKKHGRRCHRQARCEKQQGEEGHRCTCNDGYQGDGINCVRRQKDQCEKRNNQRCHKDAHCTMIDGRYQCKCREGYSGDGVSCQQRVCGKPPGIANGKVNTNQVKFIPGNIVSYQCDHRYSLVGDAQRTCLDTGNWSGTTPRCEASNNK